MKPREVVRRRKLPPPASVQVYELTDWGLEAEPIILAMGVWAIRSPRHDTTAPLSPVALMLSFRAKLPGAKSNASTSAGLAAALGFRFGAETFAVTVRDGALTAGRGWPSRPDVEVVGAPEAVAGLVYGKVPLADLEAGGALTVIGDRAVLQAFADLFELPPKAMI